MTKNVDVAVVGTELEEDVFWTVPLIDYFLYEIFASTQSKANWSFVALDTRVAVNVQLHLIIVAQNRFRSGPSCSTRSATADSPTAQQRNTDAALLKRLSQNLVELVGIELLRILKTGKLLHRGRSHNAQNA
jgi:hypothetical protein